MIQIKKLQSIAKGMDNVHIRKENTKNILEYLPLLEAHWLDDKAYNLHEFSQNELAIFLLILNATSFSYWGEPNWHILHKGKVVNGARAMIICLLGAIKDGRLSLDLRGLANLSRNQYREILRADVEIPLFNERYEIIQEISRVLLEEFNGNIQNLIDEANGDAVSLVEILVESFYFFEDCMDYEGERICLYKKAQLFVIDLYRISVQRGNIILSGIDSLTACADYKLPQVLRRLGIFEYSSSLSCIIDSHIPLASGSYEEFEIRIKTILAVEYIKEFLRDSYSLDVASYQINDMLWLLGQAKDVRDKPYHRVRSIKY